MEQHIIHTYNELDEWIDANGCQKIMLVCDEAIRFLESFNQYLKTLEQHNVKIIRFSDFQPNPQYESVVRGICLYRNKGCDSIVAVGGGSAIDVAKCIKLFNSASGEGNNGDFLKQEVVPNDIPFLVMPTTAGTGSEATRFAVIYYQGVKQSVTSESCIPKTVFMDPGALKSLPMYQRKSTMMDAFCHAIESFWSVNSDEKSRKYSREAILMIFKYMDGYLDNTDEGNQGMLKAAYLAGKAINIAQTTAGHAMCYKLTGMFGIAHGHAAFLCDRILFSWMLDNVELCSDPRGKTHLIQVFDQIADAMQCDTPKDAEKKIGDLFAKLDLSVPTADEHQFEVLKKSVNPTRLKNHPIDLTEETIDMLYRKILNGDKS